MELVKSVLLSERTQGCATDPDYWKGEVFAYVGRNQNLKDLKDLPERTQGFAADPVYGRAKCLPMLGSLKT